MNRPAISGGMLLVLCFAVSAYSQDSVRQSRCEAIISAIRSPKVYAHFFRNQDTILKDFNVSIVDKDGLLNGCTANSWGRFELTIIDSGNLVENVKRHGMYAYSVEDSPNVFILEEDFDRYNFTWPYSGANCSFTIVQRHDSFIVEDSRYGSF